MRIHTQVADVSNSRNKIILPMWSFKPRDAIEDTVKLVVSRKLGDHGRESLTECLHIVVSNSVSIGLTTDESQVEIIFQG